HRHAAASYARDVMACALLCCLRNRESLRYANNSARKGNSTMKNLSTIDLTTLSTVNGGLDPKHPYRSAVGGRTWGQLKGAFGKEGAKAIVDAFGKSGAKALLGK